MLSFDLPLDVRSFLRQKSFYKHLESFQKKNSDSIKKNIMALFLAEYALHWQSGFSAPYILDHVHSI